MTHVSPFVSFLLTRIRRWAHALEVRIAGWVPRPAPALVPIPIRADRQARRPVDHRHHHRHHRHHHRV